MPSALLFVESQNVKEYLLVALYFYGLGSFCFWVMERLERGLASVRVKQDACSTDREFSYDDW